MHGQTYDLAYCLVRQFSFLQQGKLSFPPHANCKDPQINYREALEQPGQGSKLSYPCNVPHCLLSPQNERNVLHLRLRPILNVHQDFLDHHPILHSKHHRGHGRLSDQS